MYRVRGGKTEVLMIRRNGVWDLPKGKLEAGEELAECAIREVAEETGLNCFPVAEHFLGTTRHRYNENGVPVEKETHWWSMKLAEQQEEFVPQKEEGVTQVLWVELSDSKEKAGYENLVDVLNRFESTK